MAAILTVASLFISFFVTLLILPYWIKRANTHGLVGKDEHKKGKDVAESGGLVTVLGAIIGVLFYIALLIFYFNTTNTLVYILAALCSILIALVIGFADDMLGWRVGIKARDKIFLSFLIPIPLMVVNSGHSIMSLPFFGQINLGLIYSLVIIPLGVIGASNGFNMLAGYNGLEAGNGAIILFTLGVIAWLSGAGWVAVIALSMVAALVAFLFFNWYPSEVFPGDVMTYPVGATIAIVAILANLEKFALCLFGLYFIEFLLKARGRFVPDWKSRLMKDGTLAHKGKWFTLPHVSISILKKLGIKSYEKNVVTCLLIMQSIIAIGTFSYYFCC